MKKPLFAIGALLLLAIPAQATILISDNFPMNGNLVGSMPATGGIWTTITGAANPLQVTGGELKIPATNAEDAASQFSAAQTGAIFAGFNFTLTTLPTTPQGSYIASFRDGTPGSGTYTGRFMLGRLGGSGLTEFQIGVSNTGADLSDPGAVRWATSLTLNTTYRIVLRFDTTTDQTTLWVNPVSIASTNVTATDVLSVINLDGFSFRSSSASHGASSIDGLVVGTQFSEVAVPEPSVSLCVMLGLGFGLILCKARGGRRRA